jgi:hypothetical protein
MSSATRKGSGRKVRARVVVCIVFGLALASVVLLYCLRSRSVLFRAVDKASLDKGNVLLLLNPLRDRAPERCAEAFLSKLRTDCLSTLKSELSMAEGEALRYTCEREAK